MTVLITIKQAIPMLKPRLFTNSARHLSSFRNGVLVLRDLPVLRTARLNRFCSVSDDDRWTYKLSSSTEPDAVKTGDNVRGRTDRASIELTSDRAANPAWNAAALPPDAFLREWNADSIGPRSKRRAPSLHMG